MQSEAAGTGDPGRAGVAPAWPTALPPPGPPPRVDRVRRRAAVVVGSAATAVLAAGIIAIVVMVYSRPLPPIDRSSQSYQLGLEAGVGSATLSEETGMHYSARADCLQALDVFRQVRAHGFATEQLKTLNARDFLAGCAAGSHHPVTLPSGFPSGQ